MPRLWCQASTKEPASSTRRAQTVPIVRCVLEASIQSVLETTTRDIAFTSILIIPKTTLKTPGELQRRMIKSSKQPLIPLCTLQGKSLSKRLIHHSGNLSISRLFSQWCNTSILRHFVCWACCRFLACESTLRTPAARTFAFAAGADTSVTSTFASRLVRARYGFHSLLIGFLAASVLRALAALDIRQTSCFGVDILHLLVALRVEGRQLLPRRCVHRLLEIAAQPRPSPSRFLADPIVSVDALGLVRGLVLGIEICEGGGEAIGDAVFVVEGNGALNGVVADAVAMGEILGYDA